MKECTSIFGHKFEARYDTGLPTGTIKGFKGTVIQMESLKDKKYIHDICTRCGQLIERGAVNE